MNKTPSHAIQLRAALFAAGIATLVAVSSGFADQGNGNGHGNGRADEVTSQSPQPTPTSQSPQPTPNAQLSKPDAENKDGGEASLEERHGVSGENIAIAGSATDGTLTNETASGRVGKIKLNGDTELRGTGNDELAFADLAVGLKVNAQGEPTDADGDATIVANKLIVHVSKSDESDAQSTAGDEDGGPGRGRGAEQGRGQAGEEHGRR